MNTLKIALAGQPNAGKTTVFNALTGANQKTGNYAGVTVEKIEGSFTCEDTKIEIVDLPGIYSLSTNSPEEIIARDVILQEKPDLLVNIIDSSNLERNLYLSTQLLEMNVPMLMVFNMWDVIERRGIKINLKKLEQAFGCRITTIVGHKAQGISNLKKEILKHDKKTPHSQVHYSHETEEKIKEIVAELADAKPKFPRIPLRWYAIKVMERDENIYNYIEVSDAIKEKLNFDLDHFERRVGEELEVYYADQRYGFISGACIKNVKNTVENRHSMSDKIDKIVTNKILGFPIFFALMFLVFKLTFVVGDPLMGIIELGFEHLSSFISGFWAAGSESLLKSLIVDGIIGGVGGVIVFLPNIILLFLAISILEGTGYMARAAFIMDRLMRAIGLHGNSFIPMLIGFGCTVPAIMATRTLANKKDRFTTILVAPLMSCGARLPIYALIIPGFFAPSNQAKVLWIIYFVGIALAILGAKILRSTIFKGETESFIMELPPYRIPTLRSVLMQMWGRAIVYLQKAGTVILGISIVMWVLITFPQGKKIEEDYNARIQIVQSQNISEEEIAPQVEELELQLQAEILANSITGRIGKTIEPMIKPLGFDWKIGSAMIGAFAAKEVFVAQLGIVYSVGEADEESQTLRDKLVENYSALQAIAIMLFALISAPCMATIAITKRETNSWGWAMAQLIGLTIVAYIVTFIVYQGGLLLGF